MFHSIKSRLLDHFGLEVQRSGTLANFLRTRPIDLVVDAGANLGQFARSVRQKGYRGRIHSFEPVGYVFDALQRAADRDPRWTVTRCALGDRPGAAAINVPSNHTLSSLLQLTDWPKATMAAGNEEGAGASGAPGRRAARRPGQGCLSQD